MKQRKRLILQLLASALLLTSCGQPSEPAHIQGSTAHAEKPVIYLYGYEDQEVKVKLDIDGVMNVTYPKIGAKDTWSFNVHKYGLLNFSSGEYRYLFWDADLNTSFTFTKGFCVSGSGTERFLESELGKFGFTPQEKQDFITYWLPQMKGNRYNVISFQTKAYTDVAKLEVTPKPNKLIRIFMSWYPSDTAVSIPAQNLKVPERSGRTVLEWGGAQVAPPAASLSADNITDLTGTAGTEQPQVSVPTVTDPYLAYGERAQCARDWDSSNISNTMGKWASISEGLRGEAYYHWQHYGKSGW